MARFSVTRLVPKFFGNHSGTFGHRCPKGPEWLPKIVLDIRKKFGNLKSGYRKNSKLIFSARRPPQPPKLVRGWPGIYINIILEFGVMGWRGGPVIEILKKIR